MEKIERQTKQDENTIKDIAEKLELVSNTKLLTNEELLHILTGENVVKFKMINVAAQMFVQYEKELDESNQIRRRHENYIGDDKMKKKY